MTHKYSQEAKQRISALGQTTLTEFVEEIPSHLRKILYSSVRIPGFRRSSPAALKETQKRLIEHLTHPKGGPNETLAWERFASLWATWASVRFGNAFPKSDDSEPTPDAGTVFLNDLATRFPDAAREDMERLFIFSRFPNHPDVEAALARFRTASTLERDRMIDVLSTRLKVIEDRPGITEATAGDAAKHIEQLEATAISIAKATDDVNKGSDAITELQAALDAESAHSGKIEKDINALGIAQKKVAEAVVVTGARTDALEKNMQALAACQPDWIQAAELVGILEKRVAVLEGNLTDGCTGPETRLRIRLLENRHKGPFVDILSAKDACDVIASNLQAVGIVGKVADSTARQTTAALVAGQMVQFSGSLANWVADAVAAAVGGPAYHEWRVPVGLVSDEAASEYVKTIAGSSGCLLLKSANLSAFEVYGTTIRDIVVSRQFATFEYERLALIASWAQGPAAFPGGGTLAELGPVFDTDKMKGRTGKLPKMKFGRLAKDAWAQVEGLDHDATTTAMELWERLEETKFDYGNLWKRVAGHAYAILRAMSEGNQEGDLHSLLISWAAPWAKATDGPSEEIARIADELIKQQGEVSV
jgi:hypothetical protein